ncbi:hypothetical protein OK351_09235 [Glutamicibacter sp. MNS18]|uniref:hypothetical protein n=1 Tax=Glutamicibacter sp. MNS18 TaxID=2989817 RepID=UPI002235C3B6|nr:hypothetical protein [Glutamicibacter sp. MNS18]MCW4465689.1 hypothetical protein [Glutamicibacter sp. MNS18]
MDKDKPTGTRTMNLRQWTALALAVAAAVFILQNLYRVRVQILFFHAAAPLWSVILATLVIGYLIGRLSTRR